MKAIVHTDGGSRGNPGEAAIGVVIEFVGVEKAPIEIGEKIGVTTNNVAEYSAILRALKEAQIIGVTEVECFLDSELVVRQLNRIYKIKDPKMNELAQQVFSVMRSFQGVSFVSIPREQNKKADALVNKALDSK